MPEPHPDDRDFTYSSDAESDRAEAMALGDASPERAWILTDRDVWHANPCYRGPAMPHPEDDEAHEDIGRLGIEAWRRKMASRSPAGTRHDTASEPAWNDDETPF